MLLQEIDFFIEELYPPIGSMSKPKLDTNGNPMITMKKTMTSSQMSKSKPPVSSLVNNPVLKPHITPIGSMANNANRQVQSLKSINSVNSLKAPHP